MSDQAPSPPVAGPDEALRVAAHDTIYLGVILLIVGALPLHNLQYAGLIFHVGAGVILAAALILILCGLCLKRPYVWALEMSIWTLHVVAAGALLLAVYALLLPHERWATLIGALCGISAAMVVAHRLARCRGYVYRAQLNPVRGFELIPHATRSSAKSRSADPLPRKSHAR